MIAACALPPATLRIGKSATANGARNAMTQVMSSTLREAPQSDQRRKAE